MRVWPGSDSVRWGLQLALFSGLMGALGLPAAAKDVVQAPQPALSGAELAPVPEAVSITAVEVTPSEEGLAITLTTAAGDLAAPALTVIGNAQIAEIPNAVLALPDSDEFQVANPVEGIALVTVASLPDNRVRVVITGVDAPPTRSEEHTSELQSQSTISYAVFCLKKKNYQFNFPCLN